MLLTQCCRVRRVPSHRSGRRHRRPDADGFDPARFARYRVSVADEAADAELVATVGRMTSDGREVVGESRSRTPRWFEVDDACGRLLRHSALYAHTELPASLATDPKLAPTLLGTGETSPCFTPGSRPKSTSPPRSSS